MQKSYIWTLPTRVFHTLLALFVLLAFLTNQGSKLLNYHAIAGYVVGILLVFRFFWGYIGPKYSKFKDFPLGKKNIKEFIKKLYKVNDGIWLNRKYNKIKEIIYEQAIKS